MGGFKQRHQYLAGLFEADGHVRKRQNHLEFVFVNTNQASVLNFKEMFAGSVCERIRQNDKWKTSWSWKSSNLTSPGFVSVLERCFKKSAILGSKNFEFTDAYAAGLFDGDGCVMTPMRGGRHKTCIVRVAIASEWRTELDLFQKRYGGGIYRNGGKNYCWIATGNVAEDFLLKILPHSKMKADRIREALKIRELSRELRHTFRSKQLKMVDAMLEVRSLVMAMNRKGA